MLRDPLPPFFSRVSEEGDDLWSPLCRVNTDRVSLQLEYQPTLTNNTKNIARSHMNNTSRQFSHSQRRRGCLPLQYPTYQVKTLAGWIADEDHSIDVNKGVCNTFDAKVCTTSIVRFEASKLELRPLTDWAASANPKDK